MINRALIFFKRIIVSRLISCVNALTLTALVFIVFYNLLLFGYSILLQTLIFIRVFNVCFTILGQGNVQARQVADAMLDAVIDVLSQNSSSTLKTVRIVIFQSPMIKDFYSSMQQREASDPKDKSDKSWGSTMIKNIKGKSSEEQKFGLHVP